MDIAEVAKKLSTPPGVIVAADESPSTMKARFDAVGIPDSFEMRVKWRELIATAPIADAGAVGVILHPEMLESAKLIEDLKKQGIIIIVKIDSGLVDFNDKQSLPAEADKGEQTTKFEENIDELLAKWKSQGAGATKFRSVFKITDTTPSDELIAANAKVQAILAKKTQDAGLVPMIEPEVLRTGNHTLEKDAEVTSKVLKGVFAEVDKSGLDYSLAILKPNMITAGEDNPNQKSVDEVARTTLKVLMENVPENISGINFLSGGINDELSEQYLNRICQLAKEKGIENISASFGRAIVATPLKIWLAKDENLSAAQEALVKRVQNSSLARQGKL